MESKDSASPKATHSHHAQHGHEGHGLLGAYFRDTGYTLMGSSPSIIHAPLAKRHSPATQSFPVMPTPNLNSTPNPNLNSSPGPGPPNLNSNAFPNPNSANTVYFGGAEAAGPSPASALMGSLAERSSSEPMKKKRGRPRKYTKDVNGVLVSIPPSSPPGGLLTKPKKKGPISGKKAQLLALGAAGQNFTPHVLTVGAGEDVSTKIITFTSQGPWAVCILSANGAISNATLRHAGVSGGAVTYEGRFEILSLSGSFLLNESAGTRSRTGGLSVSLAGPDGHVIGGGVAGLLTAASPVQVVVGTFFTETRKNVGSSEVVSGAKPPGLAPVRTPPPSISIMQQMRMEVVDSMQDHPMCASGDGGVQRSFQNMPLHGIDCFGSHFDGETRGDTDPESVSPGRHG